MKITAILFACVLAQGVLYAQDKLPKDIESVQKNFYRAYQLRPEHEAFGGVIARAARSSDPKQYLNNYTSDFNKMMEEKFAKIGVKKFNFANAASGLDIAVFYTDLWTSYEGNKKEFNEMIKDSAGLPEIYITFSAEHQNKIKDLAKGKLDSLYAEANEAMKLKEYHVSDRAFQLPLKTGRKREFQYKGVEVESSYATKDGKTIVTMHVSKDMAPDELNEAEDGSLPVLIDMPSQFYVRLQPPRSSTGNAKEDKWDFSKFKVNSDRTLHFENTIEYEIKDSKELERFKALVAEGPLTLAGKGANEWDVSNATLTLRIPGVTTVFDAGKPFVVVRGSDREILTGASPREINDSDYKSTPYIGAPATASGYKDIMKKLIELKKAGKLNAMAPAKEFLPELNLDVLARKSCHA